MRYLSLLFLLACNTTTATVQAPPPAPSGPDAPALRSLATMLAPLPVDATDDAHAISDAQVSLGQRLFHEVRLSKANDISCNSCHGLTTGGVDNQPTSTGHEGQRGGRNSPTVYNAALHITQFWDGRAADVEEQAKGPILNPIEMAMPDADTVMSKLRTIEGYAPLFAAAFPDESDAMTYDNLGKAIGAFERKLLTPGPLDSFLKGDDAALTDAQLVGLNTFLDVGCTTCHAGPAIGGSMYMKLGIVKPYPTQDMGRFEVTGNTADKQVFKVPSLRNIGKTGPYFHDGSVAKLDEAVRLMASHQLGKQLTSAQVREIVTFLQALDGQADPALLQVPAPL